VHKLMGEDSAGVNVIAEDGIGDESEDEDEAREEDEDEGWWVGTVGVMEMPDWAEETPYSVPSLRQACDDDHGEAEDGGQLEHRHEPPPSECSASEMAEDEWWELEPDYPSLEEGESDAARPGAVQHPLKNAARPPRPGSIDRQKLGKRPRAVADLVLGTLFDPCRLAYLAYTSND
jgi:hypothetical protein